MKYILIQISADDGNPRTRTLQGKSPQDAFDKYMKPEYKELANDAGVGLKTTLIYDKKWNVIGERPLTAAEIKESQRDYECTLRQYKLKKNKDGVYMALTECGDYLLIGVK